jgi:hypothetical protein
MEGHDPYESRGIFRDFRLLTKPAFVRIVS